MPLKEPAKKSRNRAGRISKARLATMIEEATVDAYGESEQTTGWYTMLEEHLAFPFDTTVLGVAVKVARLDLRGDNGIVAICTRGRERQSVPILDLPLPSPRPEGAEWIDAYRHWVGG
ncbi:MAG: calcium-binding protein [Casimicrobiaceae bacterium]